MEGKLLFINHRQEIVTEFAEAMKTQEFSVENFSVETAVNGYDAALLLKKQNFQVVILGLVLDGYNGDQILTFLNKCKPETVCIIYTTVLTPGQLKFLMNERRVFRILLRPLNYTTEFPKIIEEAFLECALREKEKEEKEELKALLQSKRNDLIEMGDIIKRQVRGLNGVKEFLDYLLEKSLMEKRKIMTEAEYCELYKAERELVRQYELYRKIRFRDIKTLEEQLQEEFSTPGRTISFQVEEDLRRLLPEVFLRKLKITLWVILRRSRLLTENYNAHFYLHTDKQKVILEVILDLPKGLLRERSKIPAEAVRNNIVKCLIESIGEEFVRTEKEDCLKYYIEMTL